MTTILLFAAAFWISCFVALMLVLVREIRPVGDEAAVGSTGEIPVRKPANDRGDVQLAA